MCHGQFGAVDLAGRLASQLTYRFEQQEESAHPRMIRRQSTAVGVQRQSGLIERQVAILDELPDFALAAEAKVFQHHGDRDAE